MAFNHCTIIGVDCATDPKKVGLARGIWQTDQLKITDITSGKNRPPVDIIYDWMKTAQEKCLLALDAPLGWPENFGRILADHMAGVPLQEEPNQFFRRETDRFVHQEFGKMPLDVGADRIARTALSALSLIGNLEQKLNAQIPLVWDTNFNQYGAIEVYPAGTLHASKIPSSAYKELGQRNVREEILTWLSNDLNLPSDLSLPLENADMLDAIICVLSGENFLSGNSRPPLDLAQARKEGWIWVKNIKHDETYKL